mmetsp:Transcript_63311/g.100032  ORF Transcript_63311/g.100032 Transcript_63311/m.100032 type:complete len:344 (-) Transcript_63311:18-1049(-)
MGKKGRGKKRKRGADSGKGGKGKGGGKGGSNEGKGKRHCTGERPERAFVVCSATPQQSPKATKEAQRLLASALEVLWQPKEAEPAAQEKLSVSDALEAELRELRGADATDAKAGGRPRIKFYGEVTRGVAILACPSESVVPDFPRPSVLVSSVFDAQKEESGPCARFVVRLLPLDAVCAPHLSNFRTAAAASLPKLFASARSGASWYFSYFGRAMSTIKRDDALQVLKEVLAPLGYEISVSEAEYTVLIEVNPSLCGFSVLRDYEGSLHECNLQRVSRQRDQQDSDEASDEEESEEFFDEARNANETDVVENDDNAVAKDVVDSEAKQKSDAQTAEPSTESVG